MRFEGDWEGWVKFFLTGVSEVARQAAGTAAKIIDLRGRHGEAVRVGRPKGASNAVRLLEYLFEHPHVTAKAVSDGLGVSAPTAKSLLAAFVDLGILSEVTKQSWGRVFAYLPYIDLLREGPNRWHRDGLYSAILRSGRLAAFCQATYIIIAAFIVFLHSEAALAITVH